MSEIITSGTNTPPRTGCRDRGSRPAARRRARRHHPHSGEINQAFGYIPTEALGKIRRHINAPQDGLFLADSHLYAIASFYHMFSLKPTGKHIVRLLRKRPCHVVGGRQMIQALQDYLELQPGETSADQPVVINRDKLHGYLCCRPGVMVDEDIYGNVTPSACPASYPNTAEQQSFSRGEP